MEVPACIAVLVTMSTASGRAISISTSKVLTGVFLLASVPLASGKCTNLAHYGQKTKWTPFASDTLKCISQNEKLHILIQIPLTYDTFMMGHS